MTAVLLNGDRCMKNISMILACIFLVCSSAYASSPEVKNVQYLLNQIGFNAGKEDGLYGNTTKKALVDFYESQGKIFDGSANQNEISDLILENSKFIIKKVKLHLQIFTILLKYNHVRLWG